MVFYDFEVFPFDWLVVLVDTDERSETVIVNDPERLKKYFTERSHGIWVGYNNRHYDQYIMKAILCDLDPKVVSDKIIKEGKPGWQISDLFKQIQMINYDVMLNNDGGLKSLEGMMGENIKETSVPFNINRKLTDDEIQETIEYCRHDVHKTIDVFMQRKEEFEAVRELIKIFKLPITSFSKTKAQLVAEICGGMGKRFKDNEFDFPIVPCLKLKKYRYVLDWYKNPENHDYDKQLDTIVAGVPHTFAWGGIHGAKPKNMVEGVLLNMDVTAYYPSIQLQYKFGYRNMGKPENFELIHKENLRFKALGDKKARLPFKIADNSISGQLKDKNSKLYDPMMNNAVCVNGQLMLLMLIEMIEDHAQLIQSNTDGLLIKLNRIEDFDLIDDIVYEWEQATGMNMEFELFTKVFQKDVNNYILVNAEGKCKTKGAYVKALSNLDYDLPILNEAVKNYFLKGIHPADTINSCNKLKDFQKIVKVSSKYSHALINPKITEKKIRVDGKTKPVKVFEGGTIPNEKCFRVFASTRPEDGGIFKVKGDGSNPEKFANTPERCFIMNENVNDVPIPDYLDRQWYIDTAIKRLEDFGVTL